MRSTTLLLAILPLAIAANVAPQKRDAAVQARGASGLAAAAPVLVKRHEGHDHNSTTTHNDEKDEDCHTHDDGDFHCHEDVGDDHEHLEDAKNCHSHDDGSVHCDGDGEDHHDDEDETTNASTEDAAATGGNGESGAGGLVANLGLVMGVAGVIAGIV